jgi:hypothetical protein
MAANGLSARRQQSNGKQGIPPTKRKIAARQSSIAPANRTSRHGNQRSRRPEEKIAARQSTDHAGQKKKLRHGNQGSRWPLQKSRRSNRGIAQASSKIVAGHCTGLLKNRGAAIDGSRRQKEKLRPGN